MKKILLLLCLLLCACCAQTNIKDYTVIYKNKDGTLTVAEPLILKNVDYNVIFLSNFLF